MMKKTEVIAALEDGGSIMIDTIYRRACVLDANRDEIGTCRYDTAERIERTEGYKTRRTDWYATRFVEKDWDAVSARVMAAVTETFQALERSGYISDLEIEPITAAEETETNNTEEENTMTNKTTRRDYFVTLCDTLSAETRIETITALNEDQARRIAGQRCTEFERIERIDVADALRCEMCGEILGDEVYTDDLGRRCCYECFLERCEEQGFCDLSQEELDTQATEEATPAEEAEPLPMKIYIRADGEGATFYAAEAKIWHASGLDLIIHSRYGNTGVYVHGAAQKPARTAEDENWDTCRRIAQEADAYADGGMYRCPDCGEILLLPDDVGDKYRCPHCEAVNDVNDLEQLSLWDYLTDVLDVEYTCGSNREYRSVRVMVACGGPNIYLNSATKDVELYWWNERSRYPMSYEAAEALDQWAEEYWNM